jgi:hypothetical protein
MSQASPAVPFLGAGFDIKGLKAWGTPDGGGYQYALTFNKMTVATVRNDGNGGSTLFQWWPQSQVAKNNFETFVAGLPPFPYMGKALKVDATWVASELANIGMMRKVLRTKTRYLLDGVEYEVKAKYDAAVAAYIKASFPNAIILNEDPIYTMAV